MDRKALEIYFLMRALGCSMIVSMLDEHIINLPGRLFSTFKHMGLSSKGLFLLSRTELEAISEYNYK